MHQLREWTIELQQQIIINESIWCVRWELSPRPHHHTTRTHNKIKFFNISKHDIASSEFGATVNVCGCQARFNCDMAAARFVVGYFFSYVESVRYHRSLPSPPPKPNEPSAAHVLCVYTEKERERSSIMLVTRFKINHTINYALPVRAPKHTYS